LFKIDESYYGLSLTSVREIINVPKITIVPNTPAYMKGIINLRGGVVPVIDVRLKFNMEEREYDNQTCIIVLEVQDAVVGLIVDRVSEVVDIEPEQLVAPPDMGNTINDYLDSVSEIGDKIILNIDCEKFLEQELN
jgi:purine-binding chemotaxis protein CheW